MEQIWGNIIIYRWFLRFIHIYGNNSNCIYYLKYMNLVQIIVWKNLIEQWSQGMSTTWYYHFLNIKVQLKIMNIKLYIYIMVNQKLVRFFINIYKVNFTKTKHIIRFQSKTNLILLFEAIYRRVTWYHIGIILCSLNCSKLSNLRPHRKCAIEWKRW